MHTGPQTGTDWTPFDKAAHEPFYFRIETTRLTEEHDRFVAANISISFSTKSMRDLLLIEFLLSHENGGASDMKTKKMSIQEKTPFFVYEQTF